MTVIRAIVDPVGDPGIVDVTAFAIKSQVQYQVSGGVLRQVTDKAQDTISVKDFGAVGDGVANDTAAFTAAAATGVEVLVPPGSYSLTANVTGYWRVAQSVTWTGAGRAAQQRRGFNKDVGAGVNIHRLRDRVFFGSATVSDGLFTRGASGFTWLGDAASANQYWLERDSQVIGLSSEGTIGALFGSRKSDKTNSALATIGLSAYVLNDVAPDGFGAWAAYIDAQRASGAGTTYGLELNAKNRGSAVVNGAYNRFPAGATIGMWIAAGGDATLNPPANPSSCAILIGNNSQTWLKGIVFDSTGLDSGTGSVAVEMASGMRLQWVVDSSNTLGSSLKSSVTTGANFNGLEFTENSGSQFKNASGQILFQVSPSTAAATNYVAVGPAGAGSAVFVSANGTDTNIDLRLVPKGTGLIRTGTNTAAATTPANFTADRILAFKDGTGTTYQIPCRASVW